jgi:hypothetical protein
MNWEEISYKITVVFALMVIILKVTSIVLGLLS